ncbi:AMP-binding protein [Effusibacillus dendaii]|uniref:Putative crotonobetaine/carnitine-CoA ligase n=1 Tax=Effusibacillus dendaii TaxID=2743772 RepID=A0A7I8DBM4_9BACL|nr:AMP-binding protein [Effusibacillus dendaii]BCJ86246.1 putative crotonobetaine/carnitine-CoA ligase [Effusibacillus dendaii]
MDIIGNKTLRDLLNEKTAMHRDKTFLLFEDQEQRNFKLTYGEFADQVNRLSRVFLDLGVTKGNHVTLHLPNCLEFMTSWFALANIGAIMVPTNILSTADEMEYVLNHSESILLITEEEYLEKFTGIRSRLPHLQEILLTRYEGDDYVDQNMNQLIAKAKPEIPKIPLDSEDVAAMLYTSGTTSKPKGVQITHANYLFTGEVMSKSIRLSPDDRQFIVLPLFHGNAQYYSAMSAFVVGASIAITERFSASRYFKQAKRLGATVGSLFAAPIRMILAQNYDPADQDNSLRIIWFAQSVTQEQLTMFEDKYNVSLLQMYGMTETVGVPLMNPIDGIRKNMSIGRPTIGYEVKVVDEEGKEVPTGQVGQIVVKGIPGRTLMKGYFKNPVATAEALRDGWLYTGDNARIDDDGYFYFVDRIKDMIKRAGENVAANEVESVLAEHPSVYEAAVIGIPDPMRDEAIKAYVILHNNHDISEEELLSYCRERLAKFKVPDSIEFISEFPRTSVGKIQKQVLRQRNEEGFKANS